LKTSVSSAGSFRNTRDLDAITDLPHQIPCAMRLFPYYFSLPPNPPPVYVYL